MKSLFPLKTVLSGLIFRRAKEALLFTRFVILGLLVFPDGLAAEPSALSSPDGRLAITVEVKSNPQPYRLGERIYYRVSYNGIPILADSPLGLDFKGSRFASCFSEPPVS